MRCTEETRRTLHAPIRKEKITHLVDMPCGALNWMPSLVDAVINERELEPQTEGSKGRSGGKRGRRDGAASLPFRYTGLDVSSVAIQRARKAAPSLADLRVFDATRDRIGNFSDPRHTLVLSREVHQHLSCENIVRFTRTVLNSRAAWWLVTSYESAHARNVNIQDGGWFKVDLRQAPFSFGAALATHPESSTCHKAGNRQELLLYDLEQLRKRLRTDEMLAGCALLPKS